MASFSDQLRDALLANMPLATTASGGTMVLTRCPVCGDSKNPRSRHFYISLAYDNDVSLCYCHKCHVGILLTPDQLQSWGIYDIDLGARLNKYNKKMIKKKYSADGEKHWINYKFFTDDDLTRAKANYINRRLGLNLTIKEMMDKKICLNLADLLTSNNITKFTRNYYEMRDLNSSFLGFITKDNAFVNLKNLRKGKVNKGVDKKYLNYNIFGKIDTSERMYVLPTKLNMRNNKKIKINIAEGAFDILSIYYNLRNQEDHSIYCAMCGSGYLGILKHILTDMKLFNSEFHFYKDNDIDDYIFFIIADILKVYNIETYLHINEMVGEKDFGVCTEKISEKIYLL